MKSLLRISFRLFVWLITSLVGLVLLLLVLLQFQVVQQSIINAVTSYVSGKTQTRVEIGRVSIGFPKNIHIEQLFAEDLTHDTLVSIQQLSIGADLWELCKGNIAVSSVELTGATVKLQRNVFDSTFNFNFLVQAFSSDNKEVSEHNMDTVQELMPIQVGTVILNNVRLAYDDEVEGIHLNSAIGSLDIGMEKIDLGKMVFQSTQLSLAHSRVNFLIAKSLAEDVETTAGGLLPEIGVQKLLLEDIAFTFTHEPDSFLLNTTIGILEVEPNKIDLNATNIDVKKLALTNSNVSIQNIQHTEDKVQKDVTAQTPSNSWKIQVADVLMQDNGFNFDIQNIPCLTKGIDYSHLGVSRIKLRAKDLYYSGDVIKGDIKQLQLNEQSGLVINQLRTQFILDDRHAELAGLFVQTPYTRITDYVSVSYPSLETIGQQAEALLMNVHFNQTQIAVRDVLLFAPDLEKEEFFERNRSGRIAIDGRITGSLANINLLQIVIQPAKQTAITLDGTIRGLPKTTQLQYDVTLHSLLTTETDINQLWPASYLPSGISIPAYVKLYGKTAGTISGNQSDIVLETTSGDVKLVSTISQLNHTPKYKVDIKADKLNIGAIIQNKNIGTLTGSVEVIGESLDMNSMHTQIQSAVTTAEYNRYAYSNIDFTATIDSGKYDVKLEVNDPNLKLNIVADAFLREHIKEINLNATVATARLKELYFTKENIQVNGEVNGKVTQKDSAKMEGMLSAGNVTIQKNAKPYKLDSLIAITINSSKKHSLKIDHSIVKVDYKGQTNFTEIGSVLTEYVSVLMGRNTSQNDAGIQGFTCKVEVFPHPVITEVFMPKVKAFDGLVFDATYQNYPQQFAADLIVPVIDIDGSRINRFRAKLNGKDSTLSFDISCNEVRSESIAVPVTMVSGKINQQIINYSIKVMKPDSGYKLLLAGDVNMQQKGITSIHFKNEAILGGTDWKIRKGNQIVVSEAGIQITDLELNNAQSNSLRIQSVKEEANAPVKVDFSQFELGTLSSIIEKDTAIVRGVLNGNVIFQTFSPIAFTSDIKVSDILYQNSLVGDMVVKANNRGGNSYGIQLALSGYNNSVLAAGTIKGEEVNFDINVQQLNMHTIETFVPKLISRGEGFLSGELSVSGKASSPDIDGELMFNEAGFYLAAINNRLHLRKEKVSINSDGVYFHNFTVLDATQQPLTVNGDVRMKNFKDLRFNIDITTNNFRVLNTTAEQNAMYYGVILLSSVIKVRGTDELPDVKADVHLQKGSSFTFVVQESEVSTDKGEGVVIFIDSTKLVTHGSDTQIIKASISGIEFSANLEIDPKAKFKIITDQISGDYLEVSGGGMLNFSIDASSKMSLVGTYLLDGGKYKASFQKVVKKEFDIKKGSTITWTGDPLNAEMDLTATYTTRTSPSDLFPDGLQAGNSKVLPFEVNLIVGGQLLNPKLSFLLDMPPHERANNANVYNRITDINANPDELNKQVFALLVFEGFLPSEQSSSPNASNAVSTIARNSVNQLLSDQMNRFSGKYIKGAELNFNIVSDDKYSVTGTEQNTELQIGLKKELFNSKLSVQVGGNIDLSGANNQQTSNQNITGDVVAEYKLTKDGSYRMKAFMENQYEGIVDGNLYKSGLGLMYVKDYNKFSDLFNRSKDTLQQKTK